MLSAFNVGDTLSICLFLSVIGTLLIGYPIALTLAGTSLIFAVLGHQFGAFDYAILNGLPLRYLGTMTNDVLVAVPLFIFMGLILEKSGLAEALLTSRKSTRLNSSHVKISYAVFCLKKKRTEERGWNLRP